MKAFSNYLQKYRKRNDITQKGLLDRLTVDEGALRKLDLTTLSRWENAKTMPSISKQLIVVRCLGGM